MLINMLREMTVAEPSRSRVYKPPASKVIPRHKFHLIIANTILTTLRLTARSKPKHSNQSLYHPYSFQPKGKRKKKPST